MGYKKETDIDFIERYIDEELSQKEKTEFEMRLQNDPDFSRLCRFRMKVAEEWRQASQYEKTRNRIGQIIKVERKRRRENIRYWIAAVLILCIVIPSVIVIDRQNRKNQVTDSKEYPLQMNEPEYDASIRYFDENYRQILPWDKQSLKSGESIVFQWNSGLDVRTAIIIKNAKTDSLVWRVPILSKLKEYELKKELPKGKYTWQMEGFEGINIFLIE